MSSLLARLFDEGPTLKGSTKSNGKSAKINKRTSHITIEVERKELKFNWDKKYIETYALRLSKIGI